MSQLRPQFPATGLASSGGFALFLAALFFISYWPVVLGFESFYARDYGLMGYPTVSFWRSAILDGELPLWNPYSNCGVPFLAQWGTMSLYPGMLFCLLPLPWSLNVFCLAHLWFAGVGMYRLARRWTGNPAGASLAGLVFAGCGLSQACLAWPNYCAALGWMPWVLLVGERALRDGGRWVPLSALVAAMHLLSGVPELVMMTAMLSAVMLCWVLYYPGRSLLDPCVVPGTARAAAPRTLLRASSAVLLALGLAAAQLLPFFELFSISHRMDWGRDTRWALSLSGLGSLFVPLAGCLNIGENTWYRPDQMFFASVYLGLPAVFLASLAVVRRRSEGLWAAVGIAAIGLGFSLPFWKTPSSWLRYPVKFLLLASFGLALMTAAGFARVSFGRGTQRTRRATLWLAGGLAAASGLAALLAGTQPHPLLNNVLSRAAFFLAFILLIALPRGNQWTPRACLAGLLVVLWFDFATHLPGLNPTVPCTVLPAELAPDPAWPELGEGRALIVLTSRRFSSRERASDAAAEYLRRRRTLYVNLNLLDEVPRVSGSITLRLQWQHRAHHRAVTHLTSSGNLLDFMGVQAISEATDPTAWCPRESAMPLITIGQTGVFLPQSETIDAITDPEFDPRKVVILPEELGADPGQTTRHASAAVLKLLFLRNQVSCEVETDAPTWLVVAQSWHPAWRARVNDTPARVWRANHGFQAIRVPAGKSEVHFNFAGTSWNMGLAISCLALLISLVLALAPPRRPPRALRSLNNPALD